MSQQETTSGKPKAVFPGRLVPSENTAIELRLRRALWNDGLRYRVHCRGIAGTPDIVFTRAKVAVFCDSSFWHGRRLMEDVERIHSDRDYWRSKLTANAARDRRVDAELTSVGWRVLRFWDDDINDRLQRCVSDVRSSVMKGLHQRQ